MHDPFLISFKVDAWRLTLDSRKFNTIDSDKISLIPYSNMTIIDNTNLENPPAYAPAMQQTSANVVNYGDNKQTEQEVVYVSDAHVVAANIVDPPAILVARPSHSSRTSNPPPNCPDGGQWGTLQYAGSKTCALTCLGCWFCLCLGLLFLACPQDEKDAYCVNGKLYDAAGVYISRASSTNLFIPSRSRWRFPRAGILVFNCVILRVRVFLKFQNLIFNLSFFASPLTFLRQAVWKSETTSSSGTPPR